MKPTPHNEAIKLVSYRDEYKEDFIRLNLDWIEEYFTVEPLDLKQLKFPKENIITRGGEVFFVVEGQSVKATGALVNHDSGVYEIAKMAVQKCERGRGFGGLLMEVLIACAWEKQAQKIIIVSNTRLEPALNLYKKYGFKTTRLGPDPNYERGDIEMVLEKFE